MKYKLKTTGGIHPHVLVQFEDKRYDLIGEMLLAERGLLTPMLFALNSVLKEKTAENTHFAGNAFSLFITKTTTKITNDINSEKTEASTKDLKKLIKAVQKQYAGIQR